MKSDSFIIKADICYSADPQTLVTCPDSYLVCVDGHSEGVFPTLPQTYAALPLRDYSGKLVTPGLIDLHVHAPQFVYRGLGMDLGLLDWLNAYAFPAESRYADPAYAQRIYQQFTQDVRRGPNTRACIFATLHTDATLLLMDQLEASGLCTLVGRVSMDRGSPDCLRETDARQGEADTRAWLAAAAGRYQHTAPILTPRFIPSCTDALMQALHRIQTEQGLPVQSHLSETPSEVALVHALCPDASFYGDAYARFGLFGGDGCPTIMAHCVYSGAEEIALMKQQGVFIAHCPASNTNLASGIAPVRRFLSEGLHVGLGSDVAGGTQTSIFRAMADAVQVSKLRWRLEDASLPPLTVPEAFYLGTLGGGAFFGQVGSFAPGYELDALVLDDSRCNAGEPLTLMQRLERILYLSDERDIQHKLVQGRTLF